MTNPKRTIANRMIEQDLDLYKGFYDHAWATDLFINLPPQLAEAVENLCLAWKEASNTHRLPWLMIHQMTAFAGGLLKGHKPRLARLIEEFRNWVLRELDGALKRAEKKAITESIKTIDQRLRLKDQMQDPEIPAKQYWDELVKGSEFQLSISGSQNLAFCALVFAYEWFVVSCFRVLGGDDEERPNYKKFWTDFKRLLGDDPKATYWEHEPILVAREARNCIAHLGGKAKPELLALKHNLWVSPEGVISVRASDNRTLFDVLKCKVNQLVGEMTPNLKSK